MQRPLVFILISDIQIGRFGLDPTKRIRQVAFTKNLVTHIESTYNKLPGLIPRYCLFALGDLTSTSTPLEYQVVTEELIRIAVMLNIKRSDIYLCPGNHDFNFEISKSESTKSQRFSAYANFHNEFYSNPKLLDEYKTLKGELSSSHQLEIAELLFSEVINNRYINGNKPETMNYYHIDKDLNLEVLSFNSAYLCDHTNEYRFGNFPREEILSKFNFNSESQNLRIIIGHHNYESISEEDNSSLRNSRELKQFMLQNNFSFLFHGHQHYFEIKKWIQDENEIKVIGCGALGASKEELPRGDNQITSVLINEIFCSIRSHIYDSVNKSWNVDYSLKHLPIENQQFLTLQGTRKVQQANHELIMSAEQKIEQTFINSNIPAEKDDSVRILINDANCPAGLQIRRIISANGYDQINFIEENLELEKTNDNIITFMVIPKNEKEENFVNSLIVDDQSNLIMFSDPMNWNTNAIYIPSGKLTSIVSSYNKVNEIEKPSKDRIAQLRSEIISERPNTIAESVLTELANEFKDKVLFFGIVGSSVHKETPKNLVNDIDIIILLNTITPSFIQELQLAVERAIRNRSQKGILLLPEFVDGPIRPEPEGKYTTVYQLHVLPYRIDQIQKWPSFIKINRIANHRSVGGVNLADFIKEKGDIKADLLNHKTWGIEQLIHYCNTMQYPCYKWEVIDGQAVYSKFNHPPKKIWEKLEFLNYVVSKMLRNIAVMIYGDELAQKSERQVYNYLKTNKFSSKTLELISKVIDENEKFRKNASTDIKEKNIDELKQNVISFLREIELMLKNEKKE